MPPARPTDLPAPTTLNAPRDEQGNFKRDEPAVQECELIVDKGVDVSFPTTVMSSKHDSIREVLKRLKSIERELTTVKDLIVRSVSLVPPPPAVHREVRPANFDFGACPAPRDPPPIFVPYPPKRDGATDPQEAVCDTKE